MKLALTTAALALAAALGLAASAPPALSQGRGFSTYDFDADAAVRSRTSCRLTIEGDVVHEGLCNVARRDRVTVVDTGLDKYRIVRDRYDDRRAEFYKGSRLLDDEVEAAGACWRGPVVRYCAK